MRHAHVLAIATLALVVVGAVAFAQADMAALPEEEPVETEAGSEVEAAALDADAVAALADTRAGDPQNGATLAGTCAACHGLDGASTMPDIYPNIGGQSERYIARQLALFKSGERNSPMMQPFATMLSPQDMRDLGAHFATQAATVGIADDSEVAEGPYAGMKFYEVGQKLYRGGDAERGIPACMACHGPTGAGNPGPAWPHIGGQQAWYTSSRLWTYREGFTGEQDTRLFDVMASVAKKLSDEEIEALSSYLQGLHQRPDAAMLAAIQRAASAPVAEPPANEAPAEASENAADPTQES